MFGCCCTGPGDAANEVVDMKQPECSSTKPLIPTPLSSGPASDTTVPSGRPCLHYMPHAGRGELTRLIAAVGGLEIDEKDVVEDKLSFGSPGSLPVLTHGDYKLAQSFAIESYISMICPRFSSLTPKQRAIDDMFQKIKEDVLSGFDAIISACRAEPMKKDSAPGDITDVIDKWLPIIESKLPSDGFINGLEFPTPGDLAVYNIAKAFHPFGAMFKVACIDPSAKYPRLGRHVARIGEDEKVQEYSNKTTTMEADPLALNSWQVGLLIEFDALGKRKILSFKKRPLAMTFDNRAPLTVCEVDPDGVSGRLGVEVGWVFKAVGGVELDGMDVDSCIGLLKGKTADLPTM